MFFKLIKLILVSQLFFFVNVSSDKIHNNDSIKIDYNKIYSFALDGNISSVIKYFQSIDTASLNETDKNFIIQFNYRFGYETDVSKYIDERKSKIDGLVYIFTNYWRSSLLENFLSFDSSLIKNVTAYLAVHYQPAIFTRQDFPEDSVNLYLNNYIKSIGLYTTGYGKTGKFYDLLVWRKQQDSIFNFKIADENISVDVVFMDNFITLGWEEYATFGKYYPGGWATNASIFCVKSAYDISSENFLVSYLAHESRHFNDYKIFPKLSGADLEYRAKLTELNLANKTLYEIINFFINNANYESENAHQVANFCVVRDLSRMLFNAEFEKDVNLWKEKGVETINKFSLDLFIQNTLELKKIGENVQKFIKK